MTTWFTADLHFGHANIINYSGRPFADVTAMNQALIERWNASIHPDDTVWVLGDVALGRIDETLALVGELSGRKLLLAAITTGAGRATVDAPTVGPSDTSPQVSPRSIRDRHTSRLATIESLRATSRIEATATITIGSSSSGQSIKVRGCSTATSTNDGVSAAA